MREPVLVAAVACCVLLLAACHDTTTPPSSTGSSSENDELVQQQIEQYAQAVRSLFPDAELPQVDIIRLVTPQEWPGLIAECITEAGFTATATAGGGVSMESLPEQEEAMWLASYACKASYPIDPEYNRPYDSAQLSELYRYFVEELTPCVEEFGVVVDAPPSEEVFVEGQGPATWHPYDHADTLGAARIQEMLSRCPQTPRE